MGKYRGFPTSKAMENSTGTLQARDVRCLRRVLPEVPLPLVASPLVDASCVSSCRLRVSLLEDKRRCLQKSRSMTITPSAL